MFVIGAVTAAMITILSAFNGIENVVTELFGTLDGPLAILPAEGTMLPDSTVDWLEAHWGEPSASHLILHTASVIEEECVVSWAGQQPQVVTMLAFDTNMFFAAPIVRALRSGEWQDSWGTSGPCVVVGLGVKNMLGIGAIDQNQERAALTLQAPIRGKKLTRDRERAFRSERAFACDVFSVNAEIDRKFMLSGLDFARNLFDMPRDVSRLELALAQDADPDELAQVIQETATREGWPIRTRTRAEKNQLITQTNRAEKWATFLILSFILVVAAFNVMASLTMLLLDKRQDMEVLMAMGLTGWRLEQVFALQGVIINTIGGVAGAACGMLLVLGQGRFGWVKLHGSVIPAYPVELHALDVIGVMSVVILIGGIGSGWMVRNLVHRFI